MTVSKEKTALSLYRMGSREPAVVAAEAAYQQAWRSKRPDYTAAYMRNYREMKRCKPWAGLTAAAVFGGLRSIPSPPVNYADHEINADDGQ